MKGKIQKFALNEFQQIQEETKGKYASPPSLKQITKLNMLLLALAAIEDENYPIILNALNAAFTKAKEKFASFDKPLQSLILSRMAFAAHLMNDKANLGHLQTQFELLTEEAPPNFSSSSAMAYMAALSPENYQKYKQALIQNARALKNNNEKAHVWLLALNAFAAAKAGDKTNYQAFVVGIIAYSDINNLMTAISSAVCPDSPKWLISVLQMASHAIGDETTMLALQTPITPSKSYIENYDDMLAFANQFLLYKSISHKAAMRASERSLAIGESKETLPERSFSAADRLLAPNLEESLEDQIVWQSYFQPITANYVLPKEAKGLPPKPVWVFGHRGAVPEYTAHFAAYDDQSALSLAKISLVNLPEGDYPDGNTGYVYIDALSSQLNTHRLGSYLLIHIAFNYSVQQGHEGRMELCSVNNSGPFYWKLGFVPKALREYTSLMSGHTVSGDSMYLPEEALNVWKEKLNPSPKIDLGPQKIEHFTVPARAGEAEWQQLAARLKHHAVSELTLCAPWPHKSCLRGLRDCQALKTIIFDGQLQEVSDNFFQLSELLSVFNHRDGLEHLVVRNYSEAYGCFDLNAIKVIESLIYNEDNGLQSIILEGMHIASNDFTLILEAFHLLATQGENKTLCLKNMTFAQINKDLVLTALQSDPNINSINTPDIQEHKTTREPAQAMAPLLAAFGSFPGLQPTTMHGRAAPANPEASVVVHFDA